MDEKTPALVMCDLKFITEIFRAIPRNGWLDLPAGYLGVSVFDFLTIKLCSDNCFFL